MIYELSISWRTIRQEGFQPFCRKLFRYIRHVVWGTYFLTLRMPHRRKPEEVVAFCFESPGNFIGPSQSRSEILQLVTILHQRKPKVVVEIGTAEGGTLCMWCSIGDPQAVIASIDLPGGVHGGGYPNWKSAVYRRFAQPRQSLHLLRLDSHQLTTLERLKTIIPSGGIDFLFIDGDHTYEGVKADFEMYSPLVRPGGLVVFHDICVHLPEVECHVDKFWQEIRTKYKSWEYIENPSQKIYGIGVLEIFA